MPHLKFSPSASHRWLSCPGSLTLPEPERQNSSEYAAEGSAAHDLAEQCWLTGLDPSAFIDGEIQGFPVTEEMASAVQRYMDTVEAESAGANCVVRTEAFLIHPQVSDFGGTIDCLIHGPDEITIVDFKYGAGVTVEVENNSQLLCYALLAARECCPNHEAWPRIRLVVVQPRCHHEHGPVRVWEPTEAELDAFATRIDAAMQQTDATFSAGDHCRWCPHKVNCPELQQLTLEQARAEFDESDMTPERAAEVMESAKPIGMYLKAVQDWAHSRMDKGASVPRYKLVNRFGNRRYAVDEDTVVKRCKSKKFGKKQITETKLLSPAQLEKVTGKDFVNSLCERPLLGTTVAPASDRRPAVVRQSAADEFATQETEE
jgi:hypothetical protein